MWLINITCCKIDQKNGTLATSVRITCKLPTSEILRSHAVASSLVSQCQPVIFTGPLDHHVTTVKVTRMYFVSGGVLYMLEAYELDRKQFFIFCWSSMREEKGYCCLADVLQGYVDIFDTRMINS